MKTKDWGCEEEIRVHYALENADVVSETKSEKGFDVCLKNFEHSNVKEVLIGKDAGDELIDEIRAYSKAQNIPAYKMRISSTQDLAMERDRMF